MKRPVALVKIRKMTEGDAARVAKLSTELGYPVSAKTMRRRILDVSYRHDQRLLVATIDQVVAGWLEIFLPRSVLNWGKAEVGALVVDRRFRRKGVGVSLMIAAQRWAEERNCPFVYLRSNVVRKEAHRFYEAAGFKVFKTQYVFRKNFH